MAKKMVETLEENVKETKEEKTTEKKTPAKKAAAKKTGARALRSIIEEFMMDIMYEIPKDEMIGKVIITKDYIEGKGSPTILMRSNG